MKILHLLASDRYSGAENVVCQIVDMFRDDETIEMVYCSPDGAICQTLAEKNVNFFPLKKLNVGEIKRAIREVKPDIVHAHDMSAGFFAALACGKTALISQIHNNHFGFRKVSVKSLLYFCAATKAKRIIWVSDAAYHGYRFHQNFKDKSEILYNIISASRLQEMADKAECQDLYDIVYIGRLTEQKNPQRLIGVLEAVCKKVPDAAAAIIGAGDLEAEVRALIAQKGLQDNVHLRGFMNNPYGILSKAKVMVMTSRWEGLPMCALEAMALGIPIISTPADGMRYAVLHGETGFLSEEDDELVENIASVIRDDARRAQLSENTLQRSRKIMDEQVYKSTLLSCYME